MAMKMMMKKAAMKSAMKKSMKSAMKAKAMKRSMKKKVYSKRYIKVAVFKGKAKSTVGGVKKEGLIKNKHGRVVSKKMSAKGKASKWIKAVMAARKALGVNGFSAIKKGSALYKKAKSLYK